MNALEADILSEARRRNRTWRRIGLAFIVGSALITVALVALTIWGLMCNDAKAGPDVFVTNNPQLHQEQELTNINSNNVRVDGAGAGGGGLDASDLAPSLGAQAPNAYGFAAPTTCVAGDAWSFGLGPTIGGVGFGGGVAIGGGETTLRHNLACETERAQRMLVATGQAHAAAYLNCANPLARAALEAVGPIDCATIPVQPFFVTAKFEDENDDDDPPEHDGFERSRRARSFPE